MTDLRPRFHVRASENWINDPNGPIFWNGAYHLFFQRNPHAPDWGPPNWGHAVSHDLVHWTVLRDALTPTPGGPDHGGCWSGCTVAKDGKVYALYTGVDRHGFNQAVCAAVSDGELTEWRKVPDPVIPAPPPGMDLVGFRDPYVLPQGDGWLCVIGAGIASTRGMTLLYHSTDLLGWDYIGPLYERDSSRSDPVWSGEMWECPQLFPVGEQQHLLGVSVWHEERLHHAVYFLGELLGEFDGRVRPEDAADPRTDARTDPQTPSRFVASTAGRLDYGPDYYAPTSMRDPTGRQLMWGWSWEALTAEARRASGLAGCLTVPRVVALHEGTLSVQPTEELTQLRGTHAGHHSGPIRANAAVTLAADAGACYDIELELISEGPERLELELHASLDGRERTIVFVDLGSGTAGVDTTRSTLGGDATTGISSATLQRRPDQPVRVRVLADGSILEIFVNGTPFTVRVYPTLAESRAVRLTARGGTARLSYADLWTIDEPALTFQT